MELPIHSDARLAACRALRAGCDLTIDIIVVTPTRCVSGIVRLRKLSIIVIGNLSNGILALIDLVTDLVV